MRISQDLKIAFLIVFTIFFEVKAYAQIPVQQQNKLINVQASLDTIYFDERPYLFIEEKLEKYDKWIQAGFVLNYLTGLGIFSDMIHPSYTRIPAERKLNELISHYNGKVMYGLSNEDVNAIQSELLSAQLEFPKLRRRNTILVTTGLGAIALGSYIYISSNYIQNLGTGRNTPLKFGQFMGGILISAVGFFNIYYTIPIVNQSKMNSVKNSIRRARNIHSKSK